MQDVSPNSLEVLRGTNQSGMRDHNERLVLSLVRRHGALAKSDIARMTGLSAQTVSVIMRGLEQDGLLERGQPVRGKVGQPSVPMSLAAEGAFFLGLKVGRRSADLVLTDFRGRLRAARRKVYRYPTPDTVVGFVREAAPALARELPVALRSSSASFSHERPCRSPIVTPPALGVSRRPEDARRPAYWRNSLVK
ncbi:MAG: helix-turn-helix domain-containing protein, partial [Pseudomonadota bacterium]